MPIKNINGLTTFFSLREIELAEVKKASDSIPGKRELLMQYSEAAIVDCIQDSIAFKIHAVYTGLESIFQNIAKEIDGYVPSGDSWHKELLVLMANPLKDRSAVITNETFLALSELRSFRHVIRSDYGAILDLSRVLELSDIASDALTSFTRDWKVFMAKCIEPDEKNDGGDGTGGGAAGGPRTPKKEKPFQP
jgi:hypothetical protein